MRHFFKTFKDSTRQTKVFWMNFIEFILLTFASCAYVYLWMTEHRSQSALYEEGNP